MKINYSNPSIQKDITKIKKPNAHGMLFENALNISNEYYLNKGIASIHKKPTPIQVVKVDYPARNKAKIVEAYYKVPSTTDYNGIYRGKYIDYEAKETQNLSFSFKHISNHQIEHLKKIDALGGIAFVIIFYRKINKIYLIDIKVFLKLFINSTNGSAKAIHHRVADDMGIEAVQGYSPPIDYLTAIDKLYFEK